MINNFSNGKLDFLTTFFINDCIVTKLMSEIVQNRESLFWASSNGIPADFVLPIFQEEESGIARYILKQQTGDNYQAFLLDQPCDDHELCSGDYISFKNASQNKVIRVLFVAISDIRAGYKKFKIEKGTNIFIGRAPSNDIAFGLSNFISREKHAAIRIDNTAKRISRI